MTTCQKSHIGFGISKKVLLVCLSIFLAYGLTAQSYSDSLWTIWQDESAADSVRADALEQFIHSEYYFTNPDTAIVLSHHLYEFCWQAGHTECMVGAMDVSGYLNFRIGNYTTSLNEYSIALNLADSLNYPALKGHVLVKIGYIYHDNGDISSALNYYERSLQIFERINDEDGIAAVYNEIGSIYKQKLELEKSLNYYAKALAIYEQRNDEHAKAPIYLNAGDTYLLQKDFDKASEYFKKGLAIYEKDDDQLGIASGLSSLGLLHMDQGNYDDALPYFEQSLQKSIEINDKQGASNSLLNIADIQLNTSQYAQAIHTCKRSLKLAQELGDITDQQYANESLYIAYKEQGNLNNAIVHLEASISLYDSLKHAESSTNLQQFEFSKKLLADSLIQAEANLKTQLAHQAELHNQSKNRNIAIGGALFALLLAGGFYSRWRYVDKAKTIIEKEKNRSERLLLNILPAEVAQELKEKGEAEARDYDLVSILFTDFRNYTEKSAKLSASELVDEINTCFRAFDHICEKYRVEKIKTIGDSYMAAGGLPVPFENAVENTVLAAFEMQAFITERGEMKKSRNEIHFDMRLGIHTGPVVAGIVGVKKFQYDIWGDTVNTASRMENGGEVGKVNISHDTYVLLKDNPRFSFEHRGKIWVKGKKEMDMYFIYNSD